MRSLALLLLVACTETEPGPRDAAELVGDGGDRGVCPNSIPTSRERWIYDGSDAQCAELTLALNGPDPWASCLEERRRAFRLYDIDGDCVGILERECGERMTRVVCAIVSRTGNADCSARVTAPELDCELRVTERGGARGAR
jgi:hypothetical protein